MGLTVKVGSFAQKTSTGTQAVTGVGFQPKVVLFWIQDLTADGSAANAPHSFGAATSSSNRFYHASWVKDNDGVGFYPTLGTRATKCIGVVDDASGTPARRAEADLTSMDADGFTLNWSTADATARVISYMALGGTDIVNVMVGEKGCPTVTGNQATTGLGFKPTALLLVPHGYTSAAPQLQATDARPSLGMATAAAQGVSAAVYEPSGSVGQTEAFQTATTVAARIIDYNGSDFATLGEASFVSFDADGFTLNWTTAPASARYFFWIALQGPRIKVGSTTSKSSTGTKATTGVGFQPAGLILANTDSGLTMGAASSTSNQFSRYAGATFASLTSASQDLDRAGIMKMMVPGGATPTLRDQAHLESLDSDGFTLHWTTSYGSSKTMIYIAFGPAVTGTATVASAKAALAGSGTFTAPTFTGTAAVTAKKAALAGTGAYTPPVKTGTAAVTAVKAALASSGTYAAQVKTGTVVVAGKAASISGSGTYSTPAKTGTGAVAAAKAVASASSTYTPPVKTGTGAVAAKAAALSGSATYTTSEKTGAAAVATKAAVLSTSGTYTPPTKTGTAAVAAVKAAMAGTGSHVPPGGAAVTAKPATVAASGTYTTPTKTGTAAVASVKAALSGSCTYTTPTKTGTVAVVGKQASVSITGNYIAPITGTAAVAGKKGSASISGTFQSVSTGTVAVAGKRAAAAASGTFTPPPYTATGAVASRRASVSGSGEVVRPFPAPPGAAIRVINWLRPAI